LRVYRALNSHTYYKPRIALIKHRPSFIVLFSIIFLTEEVILIKARRVSVLKVRYSLLAFTWKKMQMYVIIIAARS
jgi:hypothetical protein